MDYQKLKHMYLYLSLFAKFSGMIRTTVREFVCLIAFLFLITPAFSKAPHLTADQIKNPPPKIIRTCCAFGTEIGFAGVPFARKTDITSVSNMGPHAYMGGPEEHNGIIYTRRGGFIDLGHLRDCADWTAYLYNLIQASKYDSDLAITKIGYEGGEKTLTLRIPQNFDVNKSSELASKIAYDFSVWHEIATWFGASYVPMIPERYSSFSPEDLYSNLLGTYLGIMAIKSDKEYDEAMTSLLEEMLYNLECVDTEEETFDAMLSVDHIWYDGQKRFPNKKIILKRFLDSETALIPWIVPGMEGILPPFVLRKPNSQLSDLYQLSIKLNVRFPVKEIFSDESDRVITQKDFDTIINYIHGKINVQDEKEQIKSRRSIKRKENKKEEKELSSL